MAAVGKIHAELRAIDGFKIGQLVAEYCALRDSVIDLWEKESKGIKSHDVAKFNEAIDKALIEAVESFDAMIEHGRNLYIGILGHDLRNPLSTIIMGLSFLFSANKFGAASTRIAKNMMNTAERMSRMINDILDLTRTRFGTLIPINSAPMDIAQMCHQVIGEFEILAPANKICFTPRGNLQGEWDYDRLAQVLSNLIGNAIQYGASLEPIDITAQGKEDEVAIQVHNAGTLIPESAMSVIFDAGTRHAEKCNRSSGLGLGLFISKQVMLAHGGDIEVTSTAAEGSTFNVRLPRRVQTNLDSEEVLHNYPPMRPDK
jgi:signal transduction histidine kinase